MTMKQTARINAIDKRLTLVEAARMEGRIVNPVPLSPSDNAVNLADLVANLAKLQDIVDSLTARVTELERKPKRGRPPTRGTVKTSPNDQGRTVGTD